MRRMTTFAAGVVAFGLLGSAAQAAPTSLARPLSIEGQSLVATVQGFHRSCYWTGTSWGYKSGGKVLVCRPYKPAGAGWTWHSEGKRHGWYHAQRKAWHHQKW